MDSTPGEMDVPGAEHIIRLVEQVGWAGIRQLDHAMADEALAIASQLTDLRPDRMRVVEWSPADPGRIVIEVGVGQFAQRRLEIVAGQVEAAGFRLAAWLEGEPVPA
ncbi:MAG: hypothetical protein V2A73_08695 [Pseudomonadota bacterium]